MGLFIGSGGRMLSKQRWNQTFTAALARCAQLAQTHHVPVEMPRQVRVHDLRHYADRLVMCPAAMFPLAVAAGLVFLSA